MPRPHLALCHLTDIRSETTFAPPRSPAGTHRITEDDGEKKSHCETSVAIIYPGYGATSVIPVAAILLSLASGMMIVPFSVNLLALPEEWACGDGHGGRW